MFSIIVKRVAGCGALVALLALVASAQTTQVEGNVKLKTADGAIKPVAGALIDIYRLDIKGRWDVKTDKNGHFVRLGLPVQGTFLFVVSGPGIQPTWLNNIKISQVPSVDIVADPGDGSTLTFEQVQAALKSGGPAKTTAPTVSAGDRAKIEAEKKEYESKKKEAEALQAGFDSARTRYNTGIEMMRAQPPNYAGAITEFEAAAAIDPGKHTAMAELAYKANANFAEAHYQAGVDLFNKKDRTSAKPHFETAIAAINKSIAIASGVKDTPSINNDLIIYYNILVKNAKLLVEFYGAANLIDDTIKALDKVEALDAANKAKYEIQKGDLYRAAGMTDQAVAVYRSVLATDPGQLDALYNLGIALLGSPEKEKIQESINALADFVAKAPPTDKRVPDAKSTIEAIRTQFKVEAEKPAKRSGRKP